MIRFLFCAVIAFVMTLGSVEATNVTGWAEFEFNQSEEVVRKLLDQKYGGYNEEDFARSYKATLITKKPVKIFGQEYSLRLVISKGGQLAIIRFSKNIDESKKPNFSCIKTYGHLKDNIEEYYGPTTKAQDEWAYKDKNGNTASVYVGSIKGTCYASVGFLRGSLSKDVTSTNQKHETCKGLSGFASITMSGRQTGTTIVNFLDYIEDGQPEFMLDRIRQLTMLAWKTPLETSPELIEKTVNEFGSKVYISCMGTE